MAYSLNRWQGMGNLVNDPEIRHTNSGKTVVNIVIATETGYGDYKRTEFTRCFAWEKFAKQIAKLCKKGTQVYVEGSLRTRSWEDKDGKKRYVTEISLDKLIAGMRMREQGEIAEDDFNEPEEDDDDDLPF